MSEDSSTDYILETCDLCHNYFSILDMNITFENFFYCSWCLRETTEN